jgi:hypothetical protein
MPATSKRFDGRRRAAALAASAAALPLLPCPAACAAAPGDAPALTAWVSKSGDVTVRRNDNDATLATIKPGLFETTWQMRGNAYDDAAKRPVIRATNAGATVTVAVRPVTADGKNLRVEYVLTPDKDISVNSVHVSLSTPVASYVGGTASVGAGRAMSVAVPTSPGQSTLVSGNVGAAALEKGALRLAVDSGAQPAMVQDNRVFGGSELEIRIGKQAERVWKAGQAETFTLTVSLPGTVAVKEEAPITLAAGPDWLPLDLKLDVEPGSALDFAPLLNDAPAGKYGHVVVRPDGHFGFANRNTPQRFYGANLCFSANYLTHEEADRLAERFARIGYNTVRIHHYEGELIDTSASNSVTLRPDSLDKLDYLLAAFKKRGVYATTDLFVSRPVKPGETGIDSGGMDEFKAAVLVSPAAFENWKAFSRVLLTHVNPYTKLAYKDDPALAWLSVVNEPNLTNVLGRLPNTPKLGALYTDAWRAWLKEQYGADDKLRAAWGDTGATLAGAVLPGSVSNDRRGRDLAAFLATVHRRGYAKMKAFLRDEVKTAALLTDMNGWSETPAYMAARTDLDWVDNHFYWDHPNFLGQSWQLPSEGGSGGRGAVETAGAGPNAMSMTRLFGKPFSVSEYNYSAPNRYRAEGGLIMGAASALQDWDAVWRFAYSHSRDAVTGAQPLDYFNMATDPAGMAGERAALLLFLRGDLKPAPNAVSLVRSEKALLETRDAAPADGFRELTLVTRVGTRVEKEGAGAPPPARPTETRMTAGASGDALKALRDAGKLPAANKTDLTAGVRQSETGELFVDGDAGVLRITTPRTAGGVAQASTTLTAGPLTAAVTGTRAAVWASSLDGKPVAESRRLLLVHLTDVQNTGMRYAAPDRRVLEDWGTLPHIVRRGAATVTLVRPDASRLVAWRLDTSGKRVAPVPVRAEDGRAVLDLSTAGPDGKATLYYEVGVK